MLAGVHPPTRQAAAVGFAWELTFNVALNDVQPHALPVRSLQLITCFGVQEYSAHLIGANAVSQVHEQSRHDTKLKEFYIPQRLWAFSTNVGNKQCSCILYLIMPACRAYQT